MPFDAGKPNIARAYGYILGGKDHFAPDRALAERILAIYPGARQMAFENRRFLGRALDYVLVQGISQYVDLGAGLPTSPAVHQIVRRHSARAAVAYVDNDPVVLTHLHALAARSWPGWAGSRDRAAPSCPRHPGPRAGAFPGSQPGHPRSDPPRLRGLRHAVHLPRGLSGRPGRHVQHLRHPRASVRFGFVSRR